MASDVYELTLSAPARNALGTALMEEICHRLREAGDRPILLTGSNGAFSAGLNLKEVASLDRAGMERFLFLLEATMEAVYCHPHPVVGAVTGHAIAGGSILALCCDHSVATTDPAVRIGLNEVAIGLQFPPKIGVIARRRLAHRAERVMLEAGLYDPPAALALGLVDELSDDPLAAARAHLARLAANPRPAFTGTKHQLRGTSLPLSAEDEFWFRETLVPAWVAPEVKALVTARLAKK